MEKDRDIIREKVTIQSLFKKINSGEPITMLSCYDYPSAYFMEQAGIEIVSVGDSLGMTILGYTSTLPVTVDIMIPHVQAVRRGTPNAWLIGDMPFMSYHPSVETAIRNAGRFMAEGGCDGVKLEGGVEMLPQIKGIIRSGIPVMGHLGLKPQSSSAQGGFRLQGKTGNQAKKIIDDARALEDAGCMGILLEMVPDRVCKIITQNASIPIISLGSGPFAHGQLLIYHDMFGLYPRFKPRMAKMFGDAGQVICNGLKDFLKQVKNRQFPEPCNCFGISDSQYDELLLLLSRDKEKVNS